MSNVFTSSKSDEYYTPSFIISAVRDTLGYIELDPASSLLANKVVMADKIYTKEEDGLVNPWNAETLFMNPPYSKVLKFVTLFIQNYSSRNVKTGIVLVKTDNSTKWYDLLLNNCSAVCLVRKRIKFYDPINFSYNPPTFSSSIFYFGNNMSKFYQNFSDIGNIVTPVKVIKTVDILEKAIY